MDSVIYGGKDSMQTVPNECMTEQIVSIFDNLSTGSSKAVMLRVAFDACWNSRIWLQDFYCNYESTNSLPSESTNQAFCSNQAIHSLQCLQP